MVPLVSIVIAVYNGEKYIAETLNSLIQQTLKNWECWIVDDGSKDATLAIVKEYCSNDSRFNIIVTQGGSGPYISANRAIPFCKADFIARIDADDIALPERLRTQYDFLISEPYINLCGSYFYHLRTNGVVTERPFETDALFLKWQLIFRNRLVHSTMMIRKSWFLNIGMYPAKRLAQDWYLWNEAARQNCLFIIPKPLVSWRIHSESITKNQGSDQAKLGAEVSFNAIKKLIDYHPKSENLLAVISSIRGAATEDTRCVKESLHELIEIWCAFKKRYTEEANQLGNLRNEFLFFCFTLLFVNQRHLKNKIKLISLICQTEISFVSVRFILVFLRNELRINLRYVISQNNLRK